MDDDSVDGFADWYVRERPVVTRVVSVLARNADSAQEAADEAFTRALQRWRRVSRMESPTAWTIRVAINVLKRAQRRAVRLPALPTPPTSAVGDVTSAVWDHVRQLPERQRTAVVLRYVADLTEAQVAQTMGITRGAASASLSAARSSLAASLRRDEEEELTNG